MGYSTEASGVSSTAMGNVTKASGASSTAMGSGTEASGDFSTAIGRTTEASGQFSIAMGQSVKAKAINSTVIGKNVELSTAATGSMYLADASRSSTTIDSRTISNRFYGRFENGFYLFTTAAGYVSGAFMEAGDNSWSTISDENKKENFKDVDGQYFLESIKKMKLGSWNYIGQAKEDFRHYGPMAQEFHKYFGNDGIGRVGSDTTIASADIDGVMMIAIKALAKENDVLKKQNEKLTESMASTEESIHLLQVNNTQQNQVLQEENKNLQKEIVQLKQAQAIRDKQYEELQSQVLQLLEKQEPSAALFSEN